MMILPRLFNDDGELIDVDTSAMDAPTRERHQAIVIAYQANKQAQSELDAAHAEVARALEAVANTEGYYKARWPKQTFYDLWRENFGGGPANAKRIRGM